VAGAILAAAVAVVVFVVSTSTGAALTSVPAGSNWYCDESYEDGVCDTTVTVGETVEWEMVQGVHTVTECEDTFTVCPPTGGFDSGILNNGQTYSHTFDEVDIVEYLCTLHEQQMRGRVIVNPATASPSQTATPSASPTPSPSPQPSPGYVLTELAQTGKNETSAISMIPGTADEVVMTRRNGELWRVDLAQPAGTPTPWGNLTDRVTRNGDEGLLDVVFEPGNPSEVYVNYTRGTAYYRPFSTDPEKPVTTMPPDPKRNRVARFNLDAGGMDEASEETIYESLRPGDWHTLGALVFDQNRYLYAGSGDGGWLEAAFDSDGGQGVGNDLATIIRINPNDGAPGYTIPPGNPFNDGAGPNADQVWAYGVRSPWRFNFDSATGALWGGDVGQWQWEEVNLLQAGGNYGWKVMEGPVCHGGVACTPPANHIPPEASYCNHFNTGEPSCEFDDDCSVIGGFVYRGTDHPGIYGHYIYGDFCTGRIRAYDTDGGAPEYVLADTDLNPVDFEQLPDGELLVLDYSGSIHQLDFDADGDTVGAMVDNCPNWVNPAQNVPPWTVPADDADCDGFNAAREAWTGTDATSQCSSSPDQNDEPVDSWPPDFNDTRSTNLSDIVIIGPSYNQSTGTDPAKRRLDLNASGVVNLSDVVIMGPFYNKGCS
jgi:glucose/arabinose dehydrogenase